jgi:hypothetical protein
MKANAVELHGRIDAAQTRQLELEAERSEIAYAAHVERNAAAAKRLTEIGTEFGQLSSEIASLTAALTEVGKRAAAAEATKRDGTERDNATKALALLDSFAKRGKALDEAFDTAITEYNSLCDEFRQLDRLGYAPTTFALVNSNMRLALKTKVMGTGLVVEHLQTHLRRDFISVIEGWASHVKARAMARINRNTKAVEAA